MQNATRKNTPQKMCFVLKITEPTICECKMQLGSVIFSTKHIFCGVFFLHLHRMVACSPPPPSLVVLCKLRVFHLRPKTPAPAENFQLRQIRENSKFNGNFTFQSGSTIFVFDFNISHEHFIVCLWQACTVIPENIHTTPTEEIGS